MAEEVKKIITVEVGKSITSVRDFKKHIEDLRGALLGLNEESDEYKTIAEQIATDQAKLNEVMSVGKKNTDAASGSYVELNNQLKALRNQYKALSETERNGATGQAILTNINKLDTQLRDIDASMGQYQRNVGNYKQAFEGAFQTILGEVGKINPQLGTLISTVQKLIPAFQAVGTAAKTAGTGIKAAVSSTGIGLLVVALGEVVSHWKEISNWIDKVLGKQKDLTNEVKRTSFEINNLSSGYLNLSNSFAVELARIRGKTEREIIEDRINAYRTIVYETIPNLTEELSQKITDLKETRTNLDRKNFGDLTEEITQYEVDLRLLRSRIAEVAEVSEEEDEAINTIIQNLKAMSYEFNLLGAGDVGFYTSYDEERVREGLNQLEEFLKRERELNVERTTEYEKNIAKEKENLKQETERQKAEYDNKIEQTKNYNKTEEELRIERYNKDIEELHKYQINAEKTKEIEKALYEELQRDLNEIRKRTWESSDAYKKQQEDLNKRKEIIDRLSEYGKSELQTLEETYDREKNLIKGNGNAIVVLTREYLENRHKLVQNAQLESIEEIRNAYEREIEVRKEFGYEFEDLEKERQDRITEFVLNKYKERLQKEREVLEQGLQDQNSWTNLQLQALNTTNTRADKSKLDPLGWFTGGGEEDIQKVYDLQDKIFDVEQQGYMERIDMYQEYLSKLATDSEEYYEIQKRLHEEEMELAQLEFERQEQLADRALEKRKQTQQIILSLASSTASLYSSFTDVMLANEEQGSNRWKAYKTSEAVVNTIAGALSAFMSGVNSGVPAPWNLILAGTMAASTAAAGYAEVAKIRATKMGSTNSGSGSPTANVSGAGVEPLLNPDYDLQRMTNLSLQSDAYLPGKTQVYVLESDIQEVGNRVQVRENNATF